MLNIAKQIRKSLTRGQTQTYTMMELQITGGTSETNNVKEEPTTEDTSMDGM